MSELADLVWQSLKDEIDVLNKRVDSIAIRYERAEVSDSIPAYTFANLPTATNGGLGDNAAYTTIAWCSNSRRPGEGAGAGTGTLVFFQSSTGTWLNLHDYSAISI